MKPILPKLMIYCDEGGKRFSLSLEGEDWRESFVTLEQAFARAPALVGGNCPDRL
jgi:hypothetical protein